MSRWIGVFVLFSSACAQLVGLEDRELELDGGTDGSMNPSTALDSSMLVQGDGGSDPCQEYCGAALSLCPADAGVQIFDGMDKCLGVCNEYETDDRGGTSRNTLACRMGQLTALELAGAFEAPAYCPAAGPGGGPAMGEDSASACGSNCEGYCSLYNAVCPMPDSDCLRKCQALPDPGGFSAAADFKSGQDTLQCRLAHLSVAAGFLFVGDLDNRNNHCGHSGIRSSGPCDAREPAALKCADYCKIVMTACPGDTAVYESTDQCEKFCATLDVGTVDEARSPATLRCRREGAYTVLTSGARDLCPSAGPAPDRCEGGKCASYCLLAEKACPAEFAARYVNGGRAECENSCALLPDSKQGDPYRVGSAEATRSNSLQCRVKRVTRILQGNVQPESCEAALGLPGSDCN